VDSSRPENSEKTNRQRCFAHLRISVALPMLSALLLAQHVARASLCWVRVVSTSMSSMQKQGILTHQQMCSTMTLTNPRLRLLLLHCITSHQVSQLPFMQYFTLSVTHFSYSTKPMLRRTSRKKISLQTSRWSRRWHRLFLWLPLR
jgi:hypothetical protein